MLLEKAWAKIHGSYLRIENGKTYETFRDVTGAPAYEYPTSEPNLWELITKADKANYIIGASVNQEDEEEAKNLKSIGLINTHSYGLIRTAEVKDKDDVLTKIVQLRNPWGSYEWNGDWGDHSDKWSEDAKKQVDLVIADDGTFWMCLSDFKKYFTNLQICKYDEENEFSSI